MIAFGLALDTAALLSYSSGAKGVGKRIAEAADYNRDVLVPALCLVGAHEQATTEQWEMLELLGALPQVQITPSNQRCAAISAAGHAEWPGTRIWPSWRWTPPPTLSYRS